MNTYIYTHLKVGNEFQNIYGYKGVLPDCDYVEGAIECTIKGQVIFNKEHWDLIDQLWIYIVDGLLMIQNGNEYDTFFPDQPLRLRIVPITKYLVEVTVGNKSMKIDRLAFVSTLASGAVEFFNAMRELAPQSSTTWDKYLHQAESLGT